MLGWDINAAHFYEDIPPTHTLIIFSKHDTVIKSRASLHNAVVRNVQNKHFGNTPSDPQFSRLNLCEIGNGDRLPFVHGAPLDELLDPNGEKVEKAVKRFIAEKI